MRTCSFASQVWCWGVLALSVLIVFFILFWVSFWGSPHDPRFSFNLVPRTVEVQQWTFHRQEHRPRNGVMPIPKPSVLGIDHETLETGLGAQPCLSEFGRKLWRGVRF